MKTLLEFPTPADDATEFPFQIDGVRYEIPRFTEVIGSLGVSRRALRAGLADDDFGTRTMIALELALKDDEKALRALDHLDTKQGSDLMLRWSEFTGASLPES